MILRTESIYQSPQPNAQEYWKPRQNWTHYLTYRFVRSNSKEVTSYPRWLFFYMVDKIWNNFIFLYYRGADKSLARPGRKQATATKLWLLQSTQKKWDHCPSNQVSAAAMTSASDKKLWPLNCFFSRVGLRTYQHPCS